MGLSAALLGDTRKMLINLFDNTFRHDVCSTAWKTPKHIQYVRDFAAFDGVTLFTDGFVIDGTTAAGVQCEHKIGWLHEPPELIPTVYACSPMVTDEFETILTYHPDLLARPGFTFAPYGGVWVEQKDWGQHNKHRLCSMLYGAKRATSGHLIRHAIAENLQRYSLGYPVDFYGPYGVPTDYSIATKLRVHKTYAFSIVCEAQRLDNLFTEILLDCFAVGTVPIFWGCPNAAKFFNPAGILTFETPEQCAEIVSGLSFELYESMLPAVADNLRRVGQYAVAEDWLYLNVLREYEQGYPKNE